MDEQVFWFGVTFTFVCSHCSEPQSELATVSSPINDPNLINAQLNREKLACRHCHKPLPNGTPVQVRVSGGTLEQLKTAGFPTPGNLENN